MARVLVADDEPKLGRLVAEALEADHHSVCHVSSGRQALAELSGGSFDVVVTDLKMPEVDGLEVLAKARTVKGRPPEVVLMTAFASTETAVAAMRAGAADYLTKPFSFDELRMRVRRLAEQRATERKSEKLVERLTPALVVESPRMRAVVDAAGRVARSDASVLLLGPSGTGKSQLARYIHYSSPRAQAPLIEVHCSALSESLLESELFGHVRGAFTGADVAREGHLSRADGGTLFLDEIGEVPPVTQVKLLRFLQEREFVPVGSTEARKVSVRVIAATNRDLAAAVKAGTFREDFFYRLNVFSIDVPALRERPEDVVPLAERFLGARGLPPEKLTPRARDALLAYSWPGNVRELENALERSLILCGDGEIDPAMLGLGTRRTDAPADAQARTLLVEGFNLDVFEKELLFAALEQTGGNKAAAARLLGISRRRLYSRLESLSHGDDEGGDESRGARRAKPTD